MPNIDLVQKMFREYYVTGFSMNAYDDLKVEEREFGFISFEGKMIRHMNFQNKDEFESFLKSSSFSDVYYSCAYFEVPEAEMDKKGWLGADVIFDIDADHLLAPCSKIHDVWICSACGFVGKGFVPESCPACSGQKFVAKTWPCEVCLNEAKSEAIKLLDFLAYDFGFSDKSIHVFFSGHRGYHVHVNAEAVKGLNSNERKEIVDYVSGMGFAVTYHGLVNEEWSFSHVLRTLSFSDLGWRGRLTKGVYDFILKAKQDGLVNIGLQKNVINSLLGNKDLILRSWGDIGSRKSIKGIGFETWKKLVEHCAHSQSAHIDTVVTTDVHRLIRMPGTLHGKTGLKKAGFPVSEIEGYDPLKDAVAFRKGMLTVFVSSVPEFRLGDETMGPFENVKVDLPTAAAVLLVCKGRAKVVD